MKVYYCLDRQYLMASCVYPLGIHVKSYTVSQPRS